MRSIGLGWLGGGGVYERGKSTGYGSTQRWCRVVRLQEEAALRGG